jgi:hypothetical protein
MVLKRAFLLLQGLTHGSPYPSDPTKTNYTKLERKIWCVFTASSI